MESDKTEKIHHNNNNNTDVRLCFSNNYKESRFSYDWLIIFAVRVYGESGFLTHDISVTSDTITNGRFNWSFNFYLLELILMYVWTNSVIEIVLYTFNC